MAKAYIKGFRFHKCSPRTMHYGKLFDRVINIPMAKDKYRRRFLRVWVPDNFNIHEKVGVIYMSDGQNAVDHNLTAYGEWDMEDHLHNLENQGYQRFIIVGIDCPKNGLARMKEYTPYSMSQPGWKKSNPVYGDLYSDFIVNDIVPLINKTFNVDYDNVGFCGSSMGGLFSFHICSKYPEIFKFCLSLSPCFIGYSRTILDQIFADYHLENALDNRYAFYMGGADQLERKLAPGCDYLVGLMQAVGFDENHLLYIKDDSKIHHESAWSTVIEDLIRFVL